MATLYAIIGVPPSVSPDDLKEAYWAKARVMHPDVGGDTGKFSDLTAAYKILSDPKTRKTYDKKLTVTHVACKRCRGDGVVFSARNVKSKCPICKGEGFHGK